MKHTPGPWTVYDDSNDGKTNRIEIAALGKTVARIYHSVPAEDLPNARLIAAAPDLMEALQSAERAMSNKHFAAEVLAHDSVVREMILAAIAKATGEQP
jgi:hypothetical protein